ncbi:MAG: PASTA domain-containing protein, partial [Selenomonas sp.]|nr:PASTA domain-containing protein [Selenomonas sp.]
AVPDVQGVPLDRARAMLEGSGLKVGGTSEETSTQAEGTVIRQSPAAGTETEAGTAVRLTVSSGKGAETKNSGKNSEPKKGDKDPAGRRIQTEKTE